MSQLSAGEVAALVEGRLVGDAGVRLAGVAALDRAEAGDLSFLASARYLAAFRASRAGAVLCTEAHAGDAGPATRIVVADPHRAMLRVVRVLFPEPERVAGVHPTAVIGRGAVLGEAPALGPYVVIGAGATLGDRVTVMAHGVVGEDARVGDDSVLYPGVTVYPRTRIGRRVVVHAGCRLGSDGFGYLQGPGGHEKIPHVGGCIVEDDVEMGANCTVDRGSIDDTVIGEGTKLDNLVHVGHNVRIGRRCLVMAQVGMAGSTVVEDEVILAGQSGLAGHLTVGRRARVAAQAGVIGDVPGGASVSGFPARNHREQMRGWAALGRLAAIVDELEALVERGRQGD